jgi:putative tricarboxylic transport membrane protein
VLGQIAEQGFLRAYMIGGARDDLAGQLLFDRPISWAIVALILLTLCAPALKKLFGRNETTAEAPAHE